MRELMQSVWYINNASQLAVTDYADNLDYPCLRCRTTGRTYFPRKKHAYKIAKLLNINPVDDVYHTTIQFMTSN